MFKQKGHAGFFTRFSEIQTLALKGFPTHHLLARNMHTV